MSILSGLDSLGLGNLENANLYEADKKKAEQVKEEKKEKSVEMREEDFLFDKTYCCPICETEFKAKTVRAGKARMISSDSDLRPKYEIVDVIKYDTVVCPDCGYAALSRYFKFMTSMQAKMILNGISMNYKPRKYEGATYTYDEAIERYKLALANAIVKKAKPSEKAYICLKSAWVIRGMIENLPMNAQYVKKKVLFSREEVDYLRNAYEGFLTARSTEPFPMCGMDESTIDYLLAALAVRFEDYDMAEKMIQELLYSKSTNNRTKDRARDLKAEMDAAIKKKKEEAGQ